MALGKLKTIDNTDRKFGGDPWYYFVKVKEKGGGEAGEEYWLVTEAEALKFADRGAKNPEDDTHRRKGVLERVANADRRFGEETEYIALRILGSASKELWLLTASELERLRERTATNAEDIEANRESWMADLMD